MLNITSDEFVQYTQIFFSAQIRFVVHFVKIHYAWKIRS